MRLTLTIDMYCDQPPVDPQVQTFDTFPIIVGRSASSDYCLDAASKFVSSNHAVIFFEDNRLLIKDTSANGVYVNGVLEPIGRGNTSELSHGNTLVMGDYLLSVAITSSSTAPTEKDPLFPQIPSTRDNDPYDPFKGNEQDWSSSTEREEQSDPYDWVHNESVNAPSDTAPALIDSDWPSWPDDEQTPPRSTSSDALVNKAPRDSATEADDLDWLPLNGSETASDQNTEPNPESGWLQGNGAGAAPTVDSSGIPSTSQDAHLRALLNAASLQESDFKHRDSTEVLEQTGRLLTTMVDAMMVLLRSRAEMKNFIRSDTTQLSRTDNNPLKFSINAKDALTKLLAHDTDGYLQSDKAIHEAVEDLKLHQLAMLEGMKLAVRSLLMEFDPQRLAKKLEKSGGITASIPITREAKLWDMFCGQYDAIREEAVNDFGELFGAEFRKAYEKSIKNKGREPDF